MSLTLRFTHDELLSIINKSINEARADDAEFRSTRRRGRGVTVVIEGESPRVERLTMIRDHIAKSETHELTLSELNELIGLGEY